MARRQLTHRVYQSGISLIEVLVVLIILGLVSTLAISGGSNALLMKQRLQDASDKSFNNNLVNQWFRATIESAHPLPESPPVFTHARIQFVTQNPLFKESEIAQVSWALSVDDDYVVLTYSEGTESVEVRRWFDAEASFEFVFDNENHVFPSLLTLQVDYLTPAGRQNSHTLVSYAGLKTYPIDFRQLR